METGCLFCKIIAGGVPSEKVYEDADTLAFLDIKPNNPGHTLVVPKEHYRNIFDIPEDAWVAVMRTARHIAPAIQKAVNAGGVNITMNNEAPAHQDVFHAHVHVIPRHIGDPYKPWVGKPYTEGEAEVIAEKIKTTLQKNLS
jgi:histidine triad (HIT) family protein